MKIFVVGTNTDIGKTVISGWLALKLKAKYFKPIASGVEGGSDCDFVRNLGVAVIETRYKFKAPLSPHAAAALEGVRINLDDLVLPDTENLVIEGAGGVLVPLHENALLIDLVKKFNIPTLIVASNSLGTINHTLLTIEALRARGIEILGVILNGDDPSNVHKNAIEHFGSVKVLCEFPKLEDVSAQELLNIKLPDYLTSLK